MNITNKSIFKINGMDCHSEEQIIRMKLETLNQIIHLEFDIPSRKLEVYHLGNVKPIQDTLHELDLNERLENTSITELPLGGVNDNHERNILWCVLIINFALFIVEMTTGWISFSMGLIADSLDMLADSVVYGLSLFAVGTTFSRKKKIARISGYLQMGLALLGLSEVLRRFFNENEVPLFEWMIVVSLMALFGNLISLWLINKARSTEAHMMASAIFTSNDIIVNAGVILAGILVYILECNWPDLTIGVVVFIVVMNGALKILKLSK